MIFKTSMEAKEFLVGRIAEEANREQVLLSELERKMLFFSGTYPTLPDMMEVEERFEGEYDSDQYERKIAGLVKAVWRRDRKESAELARRWKDAIALLRREDHYILVMIGQVRPPGDLWRLLLTAVLVCVVGLSVMFAGQWVYDYNLIHLSQRVELILFAVVVTLMGFLSLNHKAGKAVSGSLVRAFVRIARRF